MHAMDESQRGFEEFQIVEWRTPADTGIQVLTPVINSQEHILANIEKEILASTTQLLRDDVANLEKAFLINKGKWVHHLPSNDGLPGMSGYIENVVISRALMRLLPSDTSLDSNLSRTLMQLSTGDTSQELKPVFYTPELREHIIGPKTRGHTRPVFRAIGLRFTKDNLEQNMHTVIEEYSKKANLSNDTVKEITANIEETGHIYFAQEAKRIFWAERQSLIQTSVHDYQEYLKSGEDLSRQKEEQNRKNGNHKSKKWDYRSESIQLRRNKIHKDLE